MLVTAWNMAIAGDSIIGGMLLHRLGVTALSPALLVLAGVVLAARHHGFPAVFE